MRYETTPDQIRYILVDIRKMLYSHPKVDPNPARVRFTTFDAYSLNIEIFAYVTVTDYSEFLEVAEDLNLRIMEIVERGGSSFAFFAETSNSLSQNSSDQDNQWDRSRNGEMGTGCVGIRSLKQIKRPRLQTHLSLSCWPP